MLSIQIIINLYLFFLGVLGIIVNRKHFLNVIICIEMMLLSINMLFLIFSLQLDDIMGQLFVIFILTVAAAESSIGLAIIISYYRNKDNISLNNRFALKG
jgi:NADH-quinone oxidoreductase subunit K